MRKDRVENETELDGDSGIGSDNEMGMENEYDDTMNQDGSDSFDGDPGDDFYRYDESDVSGDCIGADDDEEYYDDDHSVKEVLDSTDYMNSLDSIINISEIAEIAAGSISAGNGSSVNSETEKKTEDDGTEKDAQSAGTKEDSDGAVKKDKFQVLIEKGKAKGSISHGEIMEILGDDDYDIEQIDKLYENLDSLGIEVTDYINSPDLEEIESEVERYESAEDMEKMLVQEGLAIDDPVRMYLKEIGKVPLLDAEKEHALAERMAAGDVQAKSELVEANLRLVVSIAKRYVGKGMFFLDLIQEGISLKDIIPGRIEPLYRSIVACSASRNKCIVLFCFIKGR